MKNALGSHRMSSVQPPIIPVVAGWIAEHPTTISLAQGVVAYSPPETVAEYLRMLDPTDMVLHRYGCTSGIAELKAAIADKLRVENGTDLLGRTLFCTSGSNMAFLAVIHAITDPCDEVILNSPFYFNHEMAVRIAGCQSVAVKTDDDFQLQLDSLRSAITERTRAIVTVSPNNPTGAVYSEASLRAVNLLCKQQGIYHIHDEAYEYFVWEQGPHFSVASLPDSAEHTIALYSLSKAYSLAGWRMGYAVLPAGLEVAVNKVQDTNLICPPIISQRVAMAALQAGRGWCLEQLAPMAEIRREFSEKLGRIPGVRVSRCSGAFYVLLELDTDLEDVEVVRRLIVDHGVAVLPGSTFGIDGGCLLRLSFGTLDHGCLDAATDRLRRGIDRLQVNRQRG